MSSASPYRLVSSRSTAADFHARTVPEPAPREIWHHDISDPALVLGSMQDPSVVDADACRRAGVDVVRRRSGGGAVLLLPGEVTWVDVIVPAGSTGWADDVHAPMVWLGRRLVDVISSLTGIDDVVVHDAAMRNTPWSKLVCFDGVGAGEVLVGGRKLVGMSQRRTRHAARLQCCWYSTYRPERLLELLDVEVRPEPRDLRPVATVSPDVADAIVAGLADALT